LTWIGADQAEALETLKETVEAKSVSAEVESLKCELAEMRKMTCGSIFDELKKLRLAKAETEQLRAELDGYRRLVAEIQSLISGFADKKPYSKAVGGTTPKAAKNLRNAPEEIKALAMGILRDQGTFVSSRELADAVEAKLGVRPQYPISHYLDRALLEKQGERAATAWRYRTP
jgi:hypothetical protein